MNKTLTAIALATAISTTAPAQAETYASYEECLNSQGKIFASMRKGYCSDPAKIAGHAEKTYAGFVKLSQELAAEKLAEAKKAGMTCAIRTDSENMSFVLCKDEVGTFKLK